MQAIPWQILNSKFSPETSVTLAEASGYRELEGELMPEARLSKKLLNALRSRTREAPPQARAIAFTLGVMGRGASERKQLHGS